MSAGRSVSQAQAGPARCLVIRSSGLMRLTVLLCGEAIRPNRTSQLPGRLKSSHSVGHYSLHGPRRLMTSQSIRAHWLPSLSVHNPITKLDLELMCARTTLNITHTHTQVYHNKRLNLSKTKKQKQQDSNVVVEALNSKSGRLMSSGSVADPRGSHWALAPVPPNHHR